MKKVRPNTKKRLLPQHQSALRGGEVLKDFQERPQVHSPQISGLQVSPPTNHLVDFYHFVDILDMLLLI
jgi:hypothetical protein